MSPMRGLNLPAARSLQSMHCGALFFSMKKD
jgi:hypothetical protein